jgi:hypothetical protein
MIKRKKGYIFRSYEQLILWMDGISLHNKIDDECCPDFTCCANILPDDFEAKKLVFEYFMEQHADIIRNHKIEKILKN